MSEKIILDRKIGFQKTFYTKCINVTIYSIGPSIILRSIFYSIIGIYSGLLYSYFMPVSSIVKTITTRCHGRPDALLHEAVGRVQ